MIDTRFVLEVCVNNYGWIIVAAIQMIVAYILGKK